MSVFTVEIRGRAIAAFNAADKYVADHFIDDDVFRGRLLCLDTESGPLWNGIDKIGLRLALPDEAKQFQESLVNALADGETDGNDWVCFLVPVRDAADDEFDDDDDDI